MEVPESKPEPQPEAIPQHETAGLNIPTVDPILAMAREELSQNNVNGALGSYGKLIKKARYLDEVIYDLREALYRYPVDVNLWQSLGDAYMRANRLQDALDAYTKAEELLR
jgi:tetratricopeptide (TPR) repeat protein